jgi:pilus assembly protein Flp/PilA
VGLPSKLISNFVRDQSGATAIEYALIAVGLSITIIAAVQGIGTSVKAQFTSVSNGLK